jgi:hypothetical protein
MDELMEGFIHYQAQVYKNAAWTTPSSWDMRKFDFGQEIGAKTCYSMFYRKMRCPRHVSTLKAELLYFRSDLLADGILTDVTDS